MRNHTIFPALICACLFAASMPARADLTQTVAKAKPAIVGVGTILPTRDPARMFSGTGFVVGDGLTVVTNVHVLPPVLDEEKKERLVVYSGSAQHPEIHDVKVVALDPEHDIALLRRIQELTNDGVSLAGVQRILALEDELSQARERMAVLEARLVAMAAEMEERIAAVHRQYKRELVPFRTQSIVKSR